MAFKKVFSDNNIPSSSPIPELTLDSELVKHTAICFVVPIQIDRLRSHVVRSWKQSRVFYRTFLILHYFCLRICRRVKRMKEVDGLGFRKRNFKEGASLHHTNEPVKKMRRGGGGGREMKGVLC